MAARRAPTSSSAFDVRLRARASRKGSALCPSRSVRLRRARRRSGEREVLPPRRPELRELLAVASASPSPCGLPAAGCLHFVSAPRAGRAPRGGAGRDRGKARGEEKVARAFLPASRTTRTRMSGPRITAASGNRGGFFVSARTPRRLPSPRTAPSLRIVKADESNSLREPVRKRVGGSLAGGNPLARVEALRRNARAFLGGKWKPRDDGTLVRKTVGAAR